MLLDEDCGASEPEVFCKRNVVVGAKVLSIEMSKQSDLETTFVWTPSLQHTKLDVEKERPEESGNSVGA